MFVYHLVNFYSKRVWDYSQADQNQVIYFPFIFNWVVFTWCSFKGIAGSIATKTTPVGDKFEDVLEEKNMWIANIEIACHCLGSPSVTVYHLQVFSIYMFYHLQVFTCMLGSETILAAITSLFQSSLFANIPRANSILVKGEIRPRTTNQRTVTKEKDYLLPRTG